MLGPARQCSSLVALDEGTDLRATTCPVGQGANGGAVVEEEGIGEAVIVEARENGWSWAGAREAGTGDWRMCEWLCSGGSRWEVEGIAYLVPNPSQDHPTED